MSICNIAQRSYYIFVQSAKEHFWELYRYIFINAFVSINLYRYFFIKCSPLTTASGELQEWNAFVFAIYFWRKNCPALTHPKLAPLSGGYYFNPRLELICARLYQLKSFPLWCYQWFHILSKSHLRYHICQKAI